MKMKKIVTFLLMGLIFSILVTGCGGTSAATSEKKDPITIGYIAALTGPASELGIGGQKAIEMAVEEWNAKGGINGHQIKLITRDDKYDPTAGLNHVNELVNKENALAVIGPTGSSVVKATLPVTQAAGVPHIINLAQDTEFTKPAISHAYRFAMPNWIQTKEVADFINKRYNKIGIITDSTAYGMPGGDEIAAHLEKAGAGSKVVGREKYNRKDVDITAQLLRLKKAGAEVLVLWGLGADAATIRKNMETIGFKVPVIGANALVMKDFRDLAGPLVNGTFTTFNKAFLVDLTPEAQKFADAWKKKYPDEKTFWGDGDKPGYYMTSPAQTYDAANVLFTAMQNAKSLTRQDVNEAMNQVKDFKGVNGTYSFDTENHEGLIPTDNTFVKVLTDTVVAVNPDEIK